MHGEIGFAVQFSQDPVTFSENSVLKFDRPIVNVNNCYNPSTGAFTAPHTGVYDFIFTGVSAGGDEDKCLGMTDLVIQKHAESGLKPLCRCHLKAYSEIYNMSQGTDHVTVKLKKGEQVVVRHCRGDTAIRGQCLSTWSGCLMQKYPEPPPL